jgi:probable O-glycosylation ligase (exosortase A-associated)
MINIKTSKQAYYGSAMKQTIFMMCCTLAGTVGVVLISPFLGIAVYYMFAILRPQYLWEWSLPTGVSWSYYVALTTILAACGRLIAGGNEREARPAWGVGHFAVLAFGAWVGVSYVMARDHSAANFWIVEYAKIFVMFAASAILIRTVKESWILMALMALTLGYIAYEVNFLYLVNNYLGIYHNGYGGLDNNGAGLMLAMGVPLCFFAWEGSVARWRWLYLALVPVLLHAVLMTYSRGAMVSLLAVAPLIWLRSRHRRQMTAAVLGLALLLPILAGPEIRERFFTVSSHNQDESAHSRFQSWAAAWQMAREHPVFGVGLRNSNLLSYSYGADMEGRTIHSQYLQIAADTGFVGLGLYSTALASIWWGLVRVRRQLGKRSDAASRRTHALTSAIECGLAVFCVGGTFLSLDVFELPYLLLLLGAQLHSLVTVSVPAARLQPAQQPALTVRPA